MRLVPLGLLCTAAIGLTALSARADQFDYSYTFYSGDVVSGSFDGTLNGNLITNISNASVVINGVAQSGPYFIEDLDPSIPAWQDGGAYASLDGSDNNFLFINSDYANGDYSFTNFFLSVTDPTVLDGEEAAETFSSSLQVNETDAPANGPVVITDVEPSSVPDSGAALALLGLGLGGIALVRRRCAA